MRFVLRIVGGVLFRGRCCRRSFVGGSFLDGTLRGSFFLYVDGRLRSSSFPACGFVRTCHRRIRHSAIVTRRVELSQKS